VAVIEPVYPKAEGPGRPPVGVEHMLRLHCLQQWFNLSDPAVEEALYDSRAMRQFVGIDLGREPVPDETTICKFRQLLETPPEIFVQTKTHRHRPLSETERARNRTKSKVRAKVEHVFLVIKRIFGWAKVRYRGLAKNTHWLQISCGLANLYVARRRLLAGT
jgi:IS5 family transposase